MATRNAAVWARPATFQIKAYGLEFNQSKGIIGGYLTLYDNPVTGLPYIDPYLDVVVPGCMSKTIQELYHSQKSHSKDYLLPYLWQHSASEVIGGVKHLSEDSQGVIFETQLARGVAKAEECFALHEQGMPMGVSYGYDPIRTQPKDGLRYLKEVALREVSSVTFPAHEFASVTSVKNFSTKAPMTSSPTMMFDDILEDRRERDLLSTYYGFQDALVMATLSCINDDTMTDKDACLDMIIGQYSTAVKEWYPEYLAAINAPEPDGGMGDNSMDMGLVPAMMSANYALTAIKSIDLKTGKILSNSNRQRIADAIAHMGARLKDLQTFLDETTPEQEPAKSLRSLFILPNTIVTQQATPATGTSLPVAPPLSLYEQLVSDMKQHLQR